MKKNDNAALRLFEKLRAEKSMSIGEAVEFLNISESTARRLFSRLEEGGGVIRYHGGIRLASDVAALDYSYDEKKSKFVPQKKKAASAAALTVCDGDSVFIDAGTTLKHFAFSLAARLDAGEVKNITVYTSSLAVFGILRDRCRIFLIGGEYRTDRKDFSGEIARDTLSKLSLSKCYIGADGYHPASGFTATDAETARLADCAVEASEKRYIVISSEKFMKVSAVKFAKNKERLTVVTDKTPPVKVLKKLSSDGIEITE